MEFFRNAKEGRFDPQDGEELGGGWERAGGAIQRKTERMRVREPILPSISYFNPRSALWVKNTARMCDQASLIIVTKEQVPIDLKVKTSHEAIGWEKKSAFGHRNHKL